MTTINKQGVLRKQPNGRWAICWQPTEIANGEVFMLEVAGSQELKRTRMELRPLRHGGGEYYSADGYRLADGLRAAFLEH